MRAESAWWFTQALWENTQDEYGVLRKDNLLAIKEIEDRLRADENYETFCLAVSETDLSCSPEAI